MATIFLSYRRDDTEGYALLLRERLEARFGKGAVFQDITSIPPGRKVREFITGAVTGCRVMLVLIDKQWLSLTDPKTGERRLDQPNDFVRLEVAAGLEGGLRVIPVLLRGTLMPSAADLPEPLAPLADLAAHFIDSYSLNADIERLIGWLEEDLAEKPPPRVEVVAPPPEPAPLPLLPYEPEMVRIPAGPFLMGSPKNDSLRSDGEPEQFQLDLNYDYAIGRYPVTVGQYRAFMDAGGYANPAYWTQTGWGWRGSRTQPEYWTDTKWTGDPNLPVIGVSWYEAYAYTCWLAEATGRGYRLPTEAEWEKAARGGLQIPDGKGGMKKNPNPARRWPWGDEPPTKELCNFDRNVGQTSPVTSHAAGANAQPYGLYHMAGNVWEWCLSKWADPFVHPEDNDPEGYAWRVLRGSSWNHYVQRVRCSYRDWINPGNGFDDYGFRVGGVVPVLPE